MSYSEAEQRLNYASPDLVAEYERRIRKYASTRREINSRKAASNFLQAKTYGAQWRAEIRDLANQAMGILLRRILVDELKWTARRVVEDVEERSYYIYSRQLETAGLRTRQKMLELI